MVDKAPWKRQNYGMGIYDKPPVKVKTYEQRLEQFRRGGQIALNESQRSFHPKESRPDTTTSFSPKRKSIANSPL